MIRVNYNGLIADIRPQDLDDAIKILSSCPEQERAHILRSVHIALEKMLEYVEAKRTPPAKMMKNAANDVCLWFANETIEGRAENYKATMQ